MEEDYKPGKLPYPEQDDRKKFFYFHYKGVLIFLIPLIFCPILFGDVPQARRFIYLTICIYSYYIFNVISLGAIAFLYIVFMPLFGIMPSKALCTSHYSDLIFETYGAIFMGIAMDSSRLSERLATFYIEKFGGGLRIFQLLLMLTVLPCTFLTGSTLATAMGMKLAQAFVAELGNAGVLAVNSEEETYERQAPLYPTWPVVGIFLTVCYTANLGDMIIVLHNPNSFILSILEKFLKHPGVGIATVLVVPFILGLIIVALWIQIVFLGLVGGRFKEQVDAVGDGQAALAKSVADKKEAMGPMNFHCILVALLIIIGIILLVFRRPIFLAGWADKIHLTNCGASIAVILICILLVSVAANYFFCRYYVCRSPDKPGTAPALLPWKAANSNTPWAHVFMLAAAHGFAVGLKASTVLNLMTNKIVEMRNTTITNLFLVSLIGTLVAAMAPAISLARFGLLTLMEAGVRSKNGVGSMGVPFALSLHNQFMLPISSAANTIVSGFGNVRPFQYLIAGCVPTLFMFLATFISTTYLGETGFENYLKDSDKDFKYTYKP